MERQCFIDRVKNSGEFESLVQNGIVMKWLRFYDNFVCVRVCVKYSLFTDTGERIQNKYAGKMQQRMSKYTKCRSACCWHEVQYRRSDDLLLINNLLSVYKLCNDGSTVKAASSASILISVKIKRKKKRMRERIFLLPVIVRKSVCK